MGNSLDDLANHVNNKLRNVVDWCNCNKLALNPSKSEFMIVTNKIITSRPQLFIGASPIKEVSSFKYLGVHIDAQLKFHTQVHHIKGKLSQLCGVTYRLRNFLNLQAAKNLYYSCIFSVITYCIGIWGGVSQCTSRCDDIDRIHRRIVKNLFCSFYPNADCIFKVTKILKIADIYRMNAASYMYSVLKHGKYPTLRSTLDVSYPNHEYSTRGRNDLILPFPRIEAVRMNFKYQFIKVWSELPENIKSQRTSRSFKRVLMEYYLDQY